MKVTDFTTPLYEVGYGRGGARPGQQTMAHMDYRSRVQKGKQFEPIIIKKLNDLGIKTRNASKREDMYDKIDFWVDVQGNWHSVQIKQREGGDDIIFEIYKDAYDETQPPNGRDYIGKSQLYLAVDTGGRGWIANKNALRKVADAFLHQFGVDDGHYEGAQFKRTTDRSTGNPKLMAFFPPSKFGKRVF